MAKAKSVYVCQNCGAQSATWMGKCSSCHEWNTLVEETFEKTSSGGRKAVGTTTSKMTLLKEVNEEANERILINDSELNRVLGGGIVKGSVTLIGGEPGVGKSTLSLQLALALNKMVVYVSGEESEQQIKMRANRFDANNDNCYIFTETNTEKLTDALAQVDPALVIIDSIQTLNSPKVESAPGSISQIRQCTLELISYAKSNGIPIIIIGHINKDGAIAGPKVLEHMVDTVLQFEGDRNHLYRILRTHKNRFGSTQELGIYEMNAKGLKPVLNPSDVLIANRSQLLSGVTISATMEGLRPIMIETQALVSSAVYGTPQRSATGFDLRRLSMLLAVLEKRCGFKLGAKDVFLNIAGGIKVDDPAIDLAVVCAILSSNEDMPISTEICFAAEVGLSGEIRPVNRVQARIQEADKLGFKSIIVSGHKLKTEQLPKTNVRVLAFTKIEEVFSHLFG